MPRESRSALPLRCAADAASTTARTTPVTEEAPDRQDLGRATLVGVRWISVTRVVAETTALGSAVALRRLIAPDDFGHAAIALIVVALAAIIGPAGLTAALIQRKTPER